MATTAATLDILVNARTAQATSSLRRMDTSTRTSATHLRNLDRTSGRLSQTLSRAGKAAIGAGAAYVSLSAAKAAVKTTTDLYKSTHLLTSSLGLSTKVASEFGAQAQARGVDVKSLGMAFNTLSGQVRSATGGSATAIKNFKDLGISMKDLKNNSPNETLFAVTDGLNKLGPGFDKAALARSNFGRGATRLNSLIGSGSQALKEQLKQAGALGASFDDLSANKIQEVVRSQREMKLAWEGIQVSFTEALAPAITAVSDKFSAWAMVMRDPNLSTGQKFNKIADDLTKIVGVAITKATEQAGQRAPAMAEAFVKGFINAPILGQLFLGTFILKKLGVLKIVGKKFGLAIIEGLAGTKIGAALLAQFPSVARMNEEGRVRGGAMGSGMVAGLVLGTVGLAAVLGNKIASIVPNISVFSKGYIQKQFGYAFQAIQQAIPTMSNLGGKVAAAFRNPLSGGLFKGLAGELRTKLFGPFQQAAGWITGAFQKVIGFFNGLPSQIKSAFAGVGKFIISPFSNAVSAIRGFIQDIVNIINTVLGPVGVHIGGGASGGGGGQGAGNANSATHSKPRNQRQKGGGIFVGGSGSGDKVPAMLEPGEFVLNRNAVSAIGLGNVSKLNKDIPRFARGGLSSTNPRGRGATGHPTTATSAAGGFGLPGLGGIPGWLQPAGGFVLDAVGGFIRKKLSSLVPNVGGDLLLQTNTPAQVAKVLNTGVGFGRSHAGGPYTWGGGHSSFSGPYDCSGYVSAILHSMGMLSSPQTTDGLKSWGAAGPGKYMTVGVRGTTGRNAHTMMRIGNLFFESGGGHGAAVEGGWDGSFPIKRHWPGLAEGGTVMDVLKRHKIKLGPKSFDPHSPDFVGWGLQSGGTIRGYPKHGAHWIKDLGGHVDANEAATLLWQAGLSEADAGALSRVVPGESGGNPRNINPSSKAAGLFQILGAVFPGNLMDPRVNAINAAIKWRTQGRGAWEAADSGPAGHILRDRVGAVRAGTTKTPKPGKKPKGGGGDDPNAAVLQGLLDAGDTRRSSRIDLINEANLEALQRYQAGASQNPLLGIGSPGFPTPTSTNLPSPMDQMLLDLGIDPAGKPYPGARSKHPKDTPGMFAQHAKEHHHHHHTVHVHIDGKELKKGVKKETRTESRRGHRPLPSSRRS